MKSIPLYSLTLFDPNLPLVDYVGDSLDVCPIRTLLETLYVAVKLNITVQTSFPHKCGQLFRCESFKVVVAAFFQDILNLLLTPFFEAYPQKCGCLSHGIL